MKYIKIKAEDRCVYGFSRPIRIPILTLKCTRRSRKIHEISLGGSNDNVVVTAVVSCISVVTPFTTT